MCRPSNLSSLTKGISGLHLIIIIGSGAAMQYLHDRGIIRRDGEYAQGEVVHIKDESLGEDVSLIGESDDSTKYTTCSAGEVMHQQKQENTLHEKNNHGVTIMPVEEEEEGVIVGGVEDADTEEDDPDPHGANCNHRSTDPFHLEDKDEAEWFVMPGFDVITQ